MPASAVPAISPYVVKPCGRSSMTDAAPEGGNGRDPLRGTAAPHRQSRKSSAQSHLLLLLQYAMIEFAPIDRESDERHAWQLTNAG